MPRRRNAWSMPDEDEILVVGKFMSDNEGDRGFSKTIAQFPHLFCIPGTSLRDSESCNYQRCLRIEKMFVICQQDGNLEKKRRGPEYGADIDSLLIAVVHERIDQRQPVNFSIIHSCLVVLLYFFDKQSLLTIEEGGKETSPKFGLSWAGRFCVRHNLSKKHYCKSSISSGEAHVRFKALKDYVRSKPELDEQQLCQKVEEFLIVTELPNRQQNKRKRATLVKSKTGKVGIDERVYLPTALIKEVRDSRAMS